MAANCDGLNGIQCWTALRHVWWSKSPAARSRSRWSQARRRRSTFLPTDDAPHRIDDHLCACWAATGFEYQTRQRVMEYLIGQIM